MIIAKVQVSGSRCTPVSAETITKGLVGATVAIEYTDSAWDGLRKTVVFRSYTTKDVLDAGDEVTVPAEVVARAGVQLYMGVYGVDADGTVVIPTIWASLGMVRGAAAPSGDCSTDPSLPVWAQIQAMIGNLDELDTTAKSSLVAAVNEALTKGSGEVSPEAVEKIVGDYLVANPPALKNSLTIKTGSKTETYDGSAAKTVEIPDIVAYKTVTMPSYTNQIAKAGFTPGVQLDTSGAAVSGTSYVSGFIPVKKGDVIRVQDPSAPAFSTGLVFALYNSDKATGSNIGKYVNAMQTSSVYGSVEISGNVLTWDTADVGYYFWSDFAYLRVTTNSADSIVTVNEEIAYTTAQVAELKPTLKVTRENLSFQAAKPLLSGKKIAVFGDSIIGMSRDETSVTAFAGAFTGATVYNLGFGGCRMSVHPTSGYAAFSMWALADAIASGNYDAQEAQADSGEDYFASQLGVLKTIDFGQIDAIVIHYGTNDFAAGCAIDNDANDADTSTVCGALRYSVRKILTKYPKIRIFVSVPIYRMWSGTGAESYTNSLRKKLPEYVSAILAAAAEFNLPTIDGYHALGINAVNDSAFSGDGAHLNEYGRKVFGEYIGGCLIASPV